MVPAIGSSWIFWRRKQKKVGKIRQNLFKRNGGMILENMPSSQRMLRLFTAEDLKRATNNYDENQILGKEQHFGITYVGELPNEANRIVTIKKLDAVEESNLGDFIRTLDIFSHIDHQNIVKFIGCCLETPVPLIVYEYIGVKTLYDYIHDYGLSWDIHLKIASQTALALEYMHYALGQGPLIHGNVSSSSILLQNDDTVKVGDFALTNSKFFSIHLDKIGYMDPEYISSGRLTVKSDVYSFGVVLAELLTRKKGYPLEDIAQEFVSCPREDDLIRILDYRLVAEGKLDQLMEVAKLARRCLSNSSKDRPTMRDVVIVLEFVTRRNSSSATVSSSSGPGTISRRAAQRNGSF